MFGGATLDIPDLVGKMEILSIDVPLARSALDGLPAHWFLHLCRVNSDGTFRQAVFQPASFCIPLLRAHRHPLSFSSIPI